MTKIRLESLKGEKKLMKIDKEFADLIPPLTEEEYKGLEQSILAEGCRDALVVWNDTLVDGHNRYRICTEHNIAYLTVTKDFEDRNAAMLWMMNNQLSRRNLNDFQRVEIVRKCENAVKAQAVKRQEASRFGNGGGKISTTVEKSRDTLGAMAKVSGKTYEHATAIIDKAPETVTNAVRKNELSINAGYEVTKMNPEQQNEISQRIEQGEKPKDVVAEVRTRSGISPKTFERAVVVIETAPEELKTELREGNITINQAYNQIKRAEKLAKREEARQQNAEKVKGISNPLEAQGLFQTIVIDPAWDYSEEGDNDAFGRGKPIYCSMSIEDIEALPVDKIADKNCHLYIWVTNRSLPKSFHLMDKWGFRYVTCLTWIKPHYGVGNYFRGQTEHILFGVKGQQPLKRHDVGTWFEAPRGERHSAKPDEFYSLVESCSYAPYIDIFGRREREGWSVWGENS